MAFIREPLAAPIEVWRIDLSQAFDMAAGLALLDAGERDRAARFLSAEHRRRFVVAHAAVRDILGGCLAIAPGEVRLGRSARGRPFVIGGTLEFSLSHSHELALCAVASAGEFAIDIEYMRPLRHDELSRRFFSPAETAALAGIPEPERSRAFFRCWVRKEAYVKAKGMGLGLPLASFDVPVLDGQAMSLSRSSGFPDDVGAYRFHDIAAGPGYCASLAVGGNVNPAVALRDWSASGI